MPTAGAWNIRRHGRMLAPAWGQLFANFGYESLTIIKALCPGKSNALPRPVSLATSI